MSDNDTGAATANGTATFTERELQMLGWAMQSLKTGPPEIDYEKLAGFAGMSNPRSASNAWAKIKTKLITPNPDGTSPAPTPKKTAAGRKKATAAPAKDGEEGEAPTPKKTPRKRASKKQEVDGEDASPKKRGRSAKKPVSDETIKTETDDFEGIKSADAPVEPELTEENDQAEV